MYSGATPLGLVPEQVEAYLNSASLTPTGGQSSAFEDPKVPPMWDQLHAATTMDARIQAWRAIEKYLIVDQAYFAVLPGRLWVVPYRTYVQGLYPPPENQYHNLDFATVWLDK
jgi:ABC-type transport system substrate-binding protein